MSKYPKPKKKKYKKIHIDKIIRDSVIERDQVCMLCGGKQEQIHHVMTKAHSGNNKAINLLCVCNRCHLAIHANETKYFKILFKILKEYYPELKEEMMKK